MFNNERDCISRVPTSSQVGDKVEQASALQEKKPRSRKDEKTSRQISPRIRMLGPTPYERLAFRDFKSSRQPSKWAPAGGRAVTMTGNTHEPGDNFVIGLRGRWCPTICPKIAYAYAVGPPVPLVLCSLRSFDLSRNPSLSMMGRQCVLLCTQQPSNPASR